MPVADDATLSKALDNEREGIRMFPAAVVAAATSAPYAATATRLAKVWDWAKDLYAQCRLFIMCVLLSGARTRNLTTPHSKDGELQWNAASSSTELSFPPELLRSNAASPLPLVFHLWVLVLNDVAEGPRLLNVFERCARSFSLRCKLAESAQSCQGGSSGRSGQPSH